jgi:hypothetical protein
MQAETSQATGWHDISDRARTSEVVARVGTVTVAAISREFPRLLRRNQHADPNKSNALRHRTGRLALDRGRPNQGIKTVST